MAQKSPSKKQLQKQSTKAPTAGTQSLPSSPSHRTGILLLILALVAVIGLTLRGTDLRTWWLSRQSLEALHTAAADPSSDALTRYVYAKRLFDADDAKAQDAFLAAEQALSPGQNDTTAEHILAYLGYLLVANNRDEEAATRLTRAQKLNDDDPRVHLGLGMLLMDRKLYNKAELQFRIVIHTDDKSAEGWYRLGRAYLMEKSYGPAADAYQHAEALSSRNPLLYAELGMAYARQSKYDLAAPQFKKAMELDPNNFDYRVSYVSTLGYAAQTDAEYQTAVAALTDCMRRNPQNHKAEAVLGKLELRFNHPKEAVAHLQQFLKADPNESEIWFTYAQALRRLGDTPEYRRAEQHFMAMNRMQLQIMVLRTRLGADQKNIGLVRKLTQFYIQHGNYIEALKGYQLALDIQPNNPQLKQDFEKLKQTYAHVYQQNPDGDYAHNHLTQAELQAVAPGTEDQSSPTSPDEGRQDRSRQ